MLLDWQAREWGSSFVRFEFGSVTGVAFVSLGHAVPDRFLG